MSKEFIQNEEKNEDYTIVLVFFHIVIARSEATKQSRGMSVA